MSRFLTGTRYLILIPIIGLAIAAAVFFILGGIGLIRLLFEVVSEALGISHQAAGESQGVIIFEVVEYVHTFLIGTVLYITAVGLYQLFIQEIDFAGWLKIESTEELETNLIGVTVVVLAVTCFSMGQESLCRSLRLGCSSVYVPGRSRWAGKRADPMKAIGQNPTQNLLPWMLRKLNDQTFSNREQRMNRVA